MGPFVGIIKRFRITVQKHRIKTLGVSIIFKVLEVQYKAICAYRKPPDPDGILAFDDTAIDTENKNKKTKIGKSKNEK